MNAVIYARYSSDSQREESIEGQIRECKDYARKNDLTIVGTYIDRAMTGRNAERPEFQRMIKDSQKKTFDAVLVWKLDRFSRSYYDTAKYMQQLELNGVKLVSAMEEISEGPEGDILRSVLIGLNQYYSKELAIKIHRGQTENALKGMNNGGNIPLGYVVGEEHKLVIDPATATVVLEIFKLYADGATGRTVIETLNKKGILTKRESPLPLEA